MTQVRILFSLYAGVLSGTSARVSYHGIGGNLSRLDGLSQTRHTDVYKRQDSYIAIDPSLWWDRGVFLQQAAKNVYQKDFSSKHLYVAFATRQRCV